MFKKFFLFLLTGSCLLSSVVSQTTAVIADTATPARIIRFLASDAMKGRKSFSPEIDTAAAYISASFKESGLQPLQNNNFLQPFSVLSASLLQLNATVNGRELPQDDIIIITGEPELDITEKSGYTVSSIAAGENLFMVARGAVNSGKNQVLLIDSSFRQHFKRLISLKKSFFKTGGNTIFILGQTLPQSFHVSARHELIENRLTNVVGILPGKSRREEYVIFSAHYDHIGTGKPVNGDSIFNGANDDASGTAAVMTLAKYFGQKKDNQRTLVFVAFTAEETGGFGSQYFSKQLPPEKIAAMLNIEMIGTDSKWGKNSAYITGYDKSDLGKILQKNLANSGFSFYPDPYPDQQLFYRSDNATLARLGVPAHTISTSKMDAEPNYHQVSDEVETLDLKNMAEIIKAIGISAGSIISGVDTPGRVRDN